MRCASSTGVEYTHFFNHLDFASEILWPDKHLLCQGWTLFKAVLHHAKMKEKNRHFGIIVFIEC